jgi:hypothetical protein
MCALPAPLRKQLETAVLAARRAAESASRAAIDGLGVFLRDKPAHLDADQAALRNRLRAKWRQLGGDDAAQPLLIAECAYEQWHRLLFARFLAENDLLLHPVYKAPVTLADCEDLAAELGEPDGWSVAAQFASEILPGIFRLDDPCVQLRLAPEGRHDLEQILNGLPSDVFVADDALGWVYQFWQKDKKDEVNNSERKIGGADLGPVTQLFTENYMVRFLLENSLGAWWAARHPDSPLVKGFEYLRFDDNGTPAAGSFDGWPERVADVTVMDPCCGSGHFLVEAFTMLWQMRAEEEGFSPIDAQDAVLRDNLFGLELDARCVQIAMFAVALQAWKAGGGWRQLPVPNIACSGIPVKASTNEWKALARGDERLESALVRLHILFRDADAFGSLIDPPRSVEITDSGGRQCSFEDTDWELVAPLLVRGMSSEEVDPTTSVLGGNAVGMARAANYLSRRYTLIATNVPYLAAVNQAPKLKAHLATFYGTGRTDLATSMLLRCVQMTASGGSLSCVLPQNWLFLGSYKDLRQELLTTETLHFVVILGPHAFGGVPGEVVKPCLASLSPGRPSMSSRFLGLNAATEETPYAKAAALIAKTLVTLRQSDVRNNPDGRILLQVPGKGSALSSVAISYQGTTTGDNLRWTRYFWEVTGSEWILFQGSVDSSILYGGRSNVLWWGDRGKTYSGNRQSRLQGQPAWSRRGVAISQMGSLAATLYDGAVFDMNTGIIVPHDERTLPLLWAFLSSPEFVQAVRIIDTKVNVTTATLVKVPFDLDHWRDMAERAGPLPEPWSDDPRQWLFKGRPETSTAPLQGAVGRLVGYRWPEQAASDDLDALSDTDGIVCLPTVAGEAPAADRVQQVLAAAFGQAWSPARVKELLEQAGSKKKNLVDWLLDDFFKQHCALFHNRPFVWHIWDGRRDGFSALVNYHRLDRRMLEKLTYTYLGQDWMERQRAEVGDDVAGAEARLSAALELQRKLEAILYGEKPYDIYVRWKELHEQPIGWEPDLNDGVRLNVRPFVEADVFRVPPKIHWKKDRGKNPDGSERHNDAHLSLAEKLDARKRAGRA